MDAHIRDVAERYAKAGYAVLAPDLYAQGGQRPAALADERVQEVKAFVNTLPPTAWGNPSEREAALSQLSEQEAKRVGESYAALFGGLGDMDRFLPSLLAATETLRLGGKKVGSLGFCMGGSLSGLLASRTKELAAAVVFYGQGVPPDKSPASPARCWPFTGRRTSAWWTPCRISRPP